MQVALDKTRMSGLDHYMTEWDFPYSYGGVLLVVVLVLLVLLVPLVLLVLGTHCFLITRGSPQVISKMWIVNHNLSDCP